MPRFLIERSIFPTPRSAVEELQSHLGASAVLLPELGGEVEWIQSFITDRKMYCLYLAPGEDLLRTHARRGGFPADAVARVHKISASGIRCR